MASFAHFLEVPIAHRGLHDSKLGENSLGAFKAAVSRGYGIELDVHLLKDGELAVVHDNNLERVTGHKVNVEDLTSSQLAEHPLLIGKETIPTFAEVLKVIDGKVPLLVEIKVENDFNPAIVEKTMDLLLKQEHPENIAVQSFNPYAVRYAREHYPNKFPYGQLASQDLPGQSKKVVFAFKTLFVNHISKPDFLSYDINFLPFWRVRRLRKKGLPILTWTINTPEKKALAGQVADNIIFETIRP